jgi:hypothetical protein
MMQIPHQDHVKGRAPNTGLWRPVHVDHRSTGSELPTLSPGLQLNTIPLRDMTHSNCHPSGPNWVHLDPVILEVVLHLESA